MSELEFKVQNMVRTYKGTIPILLTCGHGGTKQVPGVPPRNGSNITELCKRQFETDTDIRTLSITDGLAQQIRKLTKGTPTELNFWATGYILMSTEKKNVVVKCHRLKSILKSITQQFHNLLKKSAPTIHAVMDLFSYLTSMEKAITRQILV